MPCTFPLNVAMMIPMDICDAWQSMSMYKRQRVHVTWPVLEVWVRKRFPVHFSSWPGRGLTFSEYCQFRKVTWWWCDMTVTYNKTFWSIWGQEQASRKQWEQWEAMVFRLSGHSGSQHRRGYHQGGEAQRWPHHLCQAGDLWYVDHGSVQWHQDEGICGGGGHTAC